jgi:Family of unknown function (DUF6941)
MSSSATDVEATMLLCDSAHSVGGKLYVLGGGWSILTKREPTSSMALAVKLSIPWSRANERLRLETVLITDQGEAVEQDNQPVRTEGELEVGRPTGLRHGTPLDAAFVLNFQGLDLDAGGYVWELRVNGDLVARIPFQVNVPGGS